MNFTIKSLVPTLTMFPGAINAAFVFAEQTVTALRRVNCLLLMVSMIPPLIC